MRVTLVVDSLSYGGAERHVVDLARALRARRDDVAVACSAGGPLAAELAGAGIPVAVLMKKPVKRHVSLSFSLRLRSFLADRECDLVHAHVYASAVASALATVKSSTPLVLTEHSEGRWRRRGAWVWSRLAYARAARILAVSKPIADRLAHDFGVEPARISVLPPAVPSTPGVRGREKRAHPGQAVGVVARLEPEKGVDVLLRAAARIVARCRAVHFYVVGDGSQRPALELLARELRLEANVRFLGFRADARRLMTRFDVLVVPSLVDGCPLVLQEAMLAGTPVVATSAGGIPEHIADGIDGLLVPPADVGALATAATTLLSDPALARRLAGTAAITADKRSFGDMVERIGREYRAALLDHGSAPAAAAVPAPETI